MSEHHRRAGVLDRVDLRPDRGPPAGRSPARRRRARREGRRGTGRTRLGQASCPGEVVAVLAPFSMAILTASTRLICPAPIPIVCRSSRSRSHSTSCACRPATQRAGRPSPTRSACRTRRPCPRARSCPSPGPARAVRPARAEVLLAGVEPPPLVVDEDPSRRFLAAALRALLAELRSEAPRRTARRSSLPARRRPGG